MPSRTGHSALDVDCPTCGRGVGAACDGIVGYHQARINLAAQLTRALNKAAKAAKVSS